MNKILEVHNLNKNYNGFGLKDVSFTLETGYVMGFIGPNGAGKSTTIKLIMNLISKDSGFIKAFGLDNVKKEREIKQRIGFVYDENYFYDELTIEETKKIIAGFYRKWDETVFKDYLRQFNLPPHKKIKELSKGMKMKFSLALALSHQAELIIMDEPTSGLDPVFRSEMLDIIGEIMEDENKALLFSTHITTDLDKVADFITFINDGQIVFSKEKDDILENYGVVKGSNQLLNKDIKNRFLGVKQTRFGFEALTDNIKEIYRSLKDQVIIERPTLEDIMVYTVRRGKDV